MDQMFRDSLEQLELSCDGCDCGAPSGVAPQHLGTPLAAAPEHIQAEQSHNSGSSGNSSQQQQQQYGQLVQIPESQQTHLVPSPHCLGQAVAGAPTSHKAQQQPAAPRDEQTKPSQTPGHCVPAAGGEPVMKSDYRGLTWDKKDCRWRVRIHFMGKQHHIGRFADEDEAARHFDSAAYYLFGDRAVTNFGVAAAASSNISISSNIKALLHTSISSGDTAKSAAAVPGRGWDLGATAAAAAGPATVSQPVQPPIPHHRAQRQLGRQLQLPCPSNGIMPQRTVDRSCSQQQPQQHVQAMQLERHSQSRETVDALTVRQFTTSGASGTQQEQQQQQQAIRYSGLLLPSGLTAAAAARPTPAWSLPLQQQQQHQQQQHQRQQQQHHVAHEGLLDSPIMDKSHWLINQLQQTLKTHDTHNTNIGLSRQDRLGLHHQPNSAAVPGIQPHTTAEPREAALDLTTLATAAAAEQAAEQWQQRQPKQQQQMVAEPCLAPMVVETAAAAGGSNIDPSEAVTAVLEQLIQFLSPNRTHRPHTDHTQPPRQDTVSKVLQALLNLQQQHPAGPPTDAAGRTAIPALMGHRLDGAPAAKKSSRDGPGMASHEELVLQLPVTPPPPPAAAAAAGIGRGGWQLVSGPVTNAQLVEDCLCSRLIQLHQQQQQLCHCDNSTAAGQSQLMQLKSEQLRLLLEWQQHLQGQLQHYEHEQHQALQVTAPRAGNKLMQLNSIHKEDSSSAGVAATTTVPILAAACTSPVNSAVEPGGESYVHGESCDLSAALECLVKAGTSSYSEHSKTIAGQKRKTSDDTHLPSVVSALTAAWAALQYSGGGHASSSSRDRSGRVQTPPGAASLSEADLVQQLVSIVQSNRTSHAAPHTSAAAAIAAANAAVAAAAAPEAPAACVPRSALQPAPSTETGFEGGDGPPGPQAKRQRSLASTADIVAQLLAVGASAADNTATPSTSSGMRTLFDMAAALGLNKHVSNN